MNELAVAAPAKSASSSPGPAFSRWISARTSPDTTWLLCQSLPVNVRDTTHFGIMGNRHPSIAPYQLFRAADRPIVIAVGNDQQFAAFCGGLGVPELAADPRFATNPGRVAHVDSLEEIVSARIATRPADQWFTVLSGFGVPCGPVNDIADAFALAADLGLSAEVAVGEGPEAVDLVANPVKLSDTPPAYQRRPPRLGEHPDELRAWLRDPASMPHTPFRREPLMTDLAFDYLELDSLFTAEELALRDRVRGFVDERIRPNIGEWYESAHFPRDLVKDIGALGLLGMHLTGYGCAGRSAVEYGLVAMELEAGDSGIRTFVSVQGSPRSAHGQGSPSPWSRPAPAPSTRRATASRPRRSEPYETASSTPTISPRSKHGSRWSTT